MCFWQVFLPLPFPLLSNSNSNSFPFSKTLKQKHFHHRSKVEALPHQSVPPSLRPSGESLKQPSPPSPRPHNAISVSFSSWWREWVEWMLSRNRSCSEVLRPFHTKTYCFALVNVHCFFLAHWKASQWLPHSVHTLWGIVLLQLRLCLKHVSDTTAHGLKCTSLE